MNFIKVINLKNRKNKIILSNSKDYLKINAEIYIYCSSFSYNPPKGTIICKEFAPSFELYNKKIAWIEENMIEDKFNDFKEMFLEEIKNNANFNKAIERLTGFPNVKTIVLLDDEFPYKYSHLYILANQLKMYGFRIFKFNNYSNKLIHL